MQGVDAYVHTLELGRAIRGGALVAFDMNGAPLMTRHGAPARAVVPGAYGEVSVKWLTRVTVLDHAEKGYYESQGWEAGTVHTTSAIDLPRPCQRIAAGRPFLVQGVAYAGDRGVGRVELSTDGGASWLTARIDYARSPSRGLCGRRCATFATDRLLEAALALVRRRFTLGGEEALAGSWRFPTSVSAAASSRAPSRCARTAGAARWRWRSPALPVPGAVVSGVRVLEHWAELLT